MRNGYRVGIVSSVHAIGGSAMSQVQIEQLDQAIQQAQADLVEAERRLFADPTDEFAQMSVELFRTEVESFRQIRNEEQRFAPA
jgi:wyosine [tRNA(Phe)-imidazoG37] synthetase (radical SAM superfamily)